MSRIDQTVDSFTRRAAKSCIAKIDHRAATHSFNSAQMQLYKDARPRIFAVFEEEMGWSRLEPDVIDYIREFYTQAQLDALLQFYRSPDGVNLLSKTPTALWVYDPSNQDRWPKNRPLVDDGYRDSMVRDLNAGLTPAEPNEMSSFNNSAIGKDIAFAASQMSNQLQNLLQAKQFIVMERIRAMMAELDASLAAAN